MSCGSILGGTLIVLLLIEITVGIGNVIGAVVILSPFVLIAYIFIKVWLRRKDKAETEKRSKKQKEIENRHYSTHRYHDSGYKTRPIVTGDHFMVHYELACENSMYLYCKYANTSVCANCRRRKEHRNKGSFYYGVSESCRTPNWD